MRNYISQEPTSGPPSSEFGLDLEFRFCPLLTGNRRTVTIELPRSGDVQLPHLRILRLVFFEDGISASSASYSWASKKIRGLQAVFATPSETLSPRAPCTR